MRYQIISIGLFVMLTLFLVELAHSDINWVDSVTIYPFAIVYHEGIRQITNNYSVINELRVRLSSTQNKEILSFYTLKGNDTTFVEIKDGNIVRDSNVMQLRPNETAVFDIIAKPKPDTVGMEAVVSVSVSLSTEEGGTISIIITDYLKAFFARDFNVGVGLFDAILGKVSYKAYFVIQSVREFVGTLHWYITEFGDTKKIVNGSFPIRVQPFENKTVPINFSLPIDFLNDIGKSYILHVYLEDSMTHLKTTEAMIIFKVYWAYLTDVVIICAFVGMALFLLILKKSNDKRRKIKTVDEEIKSQLRRMGYRV